MNNRNFMIGAGGLGAGILADSMFNNDDPAAAANKYLSQIPGVGKQYFNPFIQGGQEAGNILKDQYGRMLDPTALIDSIMSKYKTSQGAQYEMDKLGKGIGATAAAGGIAGTPIHQQEYGEMADKIMSGDMQQFLQNALGIYGKGIEGEQGFFDTGYDASKQLADMIGGSLASQGTLAYAGAQQNNANNQGLMSALAKALATGAGAYLGGVPGAKVGSSLFG